MGEEPAAAAPETCLAARRALVAPPAFLPRMDRYVAAAFAGALASALALIFALFVVLDAFQYLDDLAGFLERFGVAAGLGVLARYYVARFLAEVGSFGEIVAVAPAIMAAWSLARSNELVAVLAGGTSLRRAAAPILTGCALVGLACFAMKGFSGPALVRSEKADWRRIFDKTRTLGSSLSVQGASGRARVALSLEEYNPSKRTGRGFRAAVIETGKPLADIVAPVAAWDGQARAWRFPEGGRKWLYSAARPTDAPGFEPVEAFRTELDPDLLEAEELGPAVLSLGALVRQRSRPEMAAALHSQLAQVAAPLALALAALPVVLTTDRSRVLQATLLAIAVVVVYEVVARTLAGAAAAGYIPAFVGGWLTPGIFGAAGVWKMSRLDT